MKQRFDQMPIPRKKRRSFQAIFLALCLLGSATLYGQQIPLGEVYYDITEDANCDFDLDWCGGVEVTLMTNQKYNCTTVSTFEPFQAGENEHNWTCDPLNLIGTTIFTLEADRSDNFLNGVSTLDLLLIQKHILGSEPITNPFVLIAADASGTSGISLVDIIEIRQVILGVTTGWPAGSWRFIPRYFFEKNPTFCTAFNNNPFNLGASDPFLGQFDYLNYANGIIIFATVNGEAPPSTWLDFYGLKVGDVNGSATDEGLWTDPLADRAVLDITERLTAESTNGLVALHFRAKDFSQKEAFQAGIWIDPTQFEIVEVENGDLPYFSEENVYWTEEGALRVLWYDELMGEELPEKETELFTVWVRPLQKDWNASAAIRLDDAVLPTGFFDLDDELVLTTLELELVRPLEDQVNLQATLAPNPVRDIARLELLLPQAGNCQVRIFDAYGRQVQAFEQSLQEGQHTILLTDLGMLTSGIYLYEVRSGEQRVTGKFMK